VTLTDYHTHLRPDASDASPEGYFTEANVLRYLESAASSGIGELGFAEHVHRFRQALDVWRHPFWEENAVDDLDHYCAFVEEMKHAGHRVKLGLEVDYIPGREEQIAALIEGRPFDYVVGSVHFIADQAVDHAGYDAWIGSSSDEVWERYFRTLGAAAASGLYDILAHPDLVKVWGPERADPSLDRRRFYELAIEGIAGSDIAIEVSTAGLRKPVAEIYPSRELLEMCLDVGRPVALSSDAHEPEQIGYEYESALRLLREVGVEGLSVFTGRERRQEPLP
jgi:histidinol-phosphatase (PHP family)